MTVAGGTLRIGHGAETLGSLAGQGNVVIGDGGLAVAGNASTSFGGAITGTGGVTKNGTGVWTLGGANSYSGNTTLNAGTIRLDANEVIPDGAGQGNLFLNVGATLDLRGFSETVNGLAGGGTINSTTAGNSTISVGGNDQSSSFAGVIQNSAGAVGLTKVGLGSLSISGLNTYSGPTNVNEGTLQILGAPTAYRYFRFTPTLLRNSPGAANSVQLSEFQIFLGAGLLTGAVATNPGGSSPVGETPPMSVDNNLNTKWLDFNKGSLVLDYGSARSFDRYRWATANDAAERDAIRWKLEGSTNSGRTVAPGASGVGKLTVGGVSFSPGATLDVDLNGAGAGQFDQLAVSTGAVDLNSVNLKPTIGYAAADGDMYRILDKLSAGAESGLVSNAVVSSSAFQVNQTGGDGNDLVLTYSSDAPTVANIGDSDADNSVSINEAITYAVTFSQDINHTTVSSADFNNAGTASVTFGAITETSPGVLTVVVTPTSAGTIILRTPAGATILDNAGAAVAGPVSDDDTVTVQAPAPVAWGATSYTMSTIAGYMLGSQFAVANPITISHLGFFDGQQNGLTGSHPVGIWSVGGGLLAQTTVVPTDPLNNHFRYHALSTPLTIPTGTYVVGALYNSTEEYGYSPSGFTTYPGISFQGARYSSTSSFSFPGTFSSGFLGYFGADFLIGSANSPPNVASNSAAVTANEGGAASNSGTFSDPQGNGAVTLTASIGAVTKNDTLGTWSWSLNADDGPAGPFTVTITATDDAGAAAQSTFTFAIDNVPPTISLSGAAEIDEGSTYTLHLGAVTDPGRDSIQSYSINWGDGTVDTFGSTANPANPANTTATHTFVDGPATRLNKVTVTDEDGNFLAGELSVKVRNVAPTAAFSVQGNAPVTYGQTVTVTGVGDDGILFTDSLSATNAGSYSKDWSFKNDNYNTSGESGTLEFSIYKAPSTTTVTLVGGPFTYTGAAQTPATVTVTGAGGLSLTPAADFANNTDAGTATASYNFAGDANHEASSDSKNFAIAKSNQIITWADPSAINYGTPLSGKQLNATVAGVSGGSAPGALTYTPAAGTVLLAGTQTLIVTAAATTNYEAATKSLSLVVNPYLSSGFLAPISLNRAFKQGSTVPIKWILQDANGNMVTSLSAVTNLTVTGPGGTTTLYPGNSNSSGSTVLRHDGSQFIYNWQTKGFALGNYTIEAQLADGKSVTQTIMLSKSGAASALVIDGVKGVTAVGALLAGDMTVYVDNSNGAFSTDQLARIEDAVARIESLVSPYGANIVLVDASVGRNANIVLDSGDTSVLGGMADGILGVTTSAGEITIIRGWNWYAGVATGAIAAGQYDFQTVVTHEIGHGLGLGHNLVTSSVMFPELGTADARRTLTVADLNTEGDDDDGAGLHVEAIFAAGFESSHAEPESHGEQAGVPVPFSPYLGNFDATWDGATWDSLIGPTRNGGSTPRDGVRDAVLPREVMLSGFGAGPVLAEAEAGVGFFEREDASSSKAKKEEDRDAAWSADVDALFAQQQDLP